MPVLNPTTGDAACGIGCIQISIQGGVPAALAGVIGGGCCWLTATKMIYQDCADAHLKTYDTGTTAIATVSTSGATKIGAGSGVWAAFLADGVSGVRTNVGGFGPFPAASLAAVGEDGSVAIVTTYQLGRGLTVYGPTGSVLSTIDITIFYPVFALRHGILAYSIGANTWVLRTTAGVQLSYAQRSTGDTNWVVPVVSGDVVWVMERQGDLTLRPKDSGLGYRLPGTAGVSYNPDAIEVSPGVIRVAWADPGDSVNSLRLLDVTLATGANTLGVPTAGVIVWTPQAALPVVDLGAGGASPSGPYVVPYTKPMWVGSFYASSEQYGYFDTPGNAEVLLASTVASVLTGSDWRKMRRPRPVIIDTPSLGVFAPPVNSDIAYWTAAAPSVTLTQAINTNRPLAQALGIGLAVYTDARVFDQSIRSLLLPGDRLLPQCYRGNGESVGAFQSDLLAQVAAISDWGYPVDLVCGASDRGFLSDTQLEECFPVYDVVSRQAVVAGLWFFAWGRPTGIITHSALLTPWINAFSLAAGGGSAPVPPSPVPPIPPPPSGGGGTPSPAPGGIKKADLPKAKVARAYPHVDQIQDPHAQASLRMLWDKVWGAQDTHTETQQTVQAQATQITQLQAQVTEAQAMARQATLQAGVGVPGVGSGTPGGGGGDPGTDNGEGANGCGASGANGHVPPGSPLTAYTAGQIVCGTAKEFPALLVACPDQATRDANMTELGGRMVWHLGQAGFAATQYLPNNLYVLFIGIGADTYTYRVMGYENFSVPMVVVMEFHRKAIGETPPAAGGIPD